MSPSVPVSWGEVIDKIPILEIKSAKLTSEAALKNVHHELAELSKVAADVLRANPKAAALKAALKHINETLWQIEDDIREKEARKTFDAGLDRKSTRLNSSHVALSRMPSSA